MSQNFPSRRGLILLGSLLATTILSSCKKDPPLTAGSGPEQEFAHCLKLAANKSYDDTVRCLEIVKARYPQSSVSQKAELHIGDIYYRRKEYLLAAEAYKAFTKMYPASPEIDYAYFRAGMSYFRESPKAYDRDQEQLNEAIDNFEIVVTQFPNSAYRNMAASFLNKALTRVAQRNFYVGRFYYKKGQYIAAIPRFALVAKNNFDSTLTPKALYYATLANIKLDALEDAKTVFSDMAERFPGNKLTADAQKKLFAAVEHAQRHEKKTGER